MIFTLFVYIGCSLSGSRDGLNGYKGALQWQISRDGEVWSDVPNSTADTLEVSASNSHNYRGSVTVTGCPKYYTDTVQLLAGSSSSIPEPQGLLVDSRVNPLAVQDEYPLLSWRLTDSRPGSQQETYHIIVASSAESLACEEGDLWDTGMVVSTMQSVRYAGKPIPAGGVALWKVMYRDPVYGESPWSEVAVWETGLQRK